MASRMYRLTVEGELSDRIAPSFGGMALERVGGNTTLTGPVRDQAELHGLLGHVSELGLTLLEVSVVGPAPGDGRRAS